MHGNLGKLKFSNKYYKEKQKYQVDEMVVDENWSRRNGCRQIKSRQARMLLN